MRFQISLSGDFREKLTNFSLQFRPTQKSLAILESHHPQLIALRCHFLAIEPFRVSFFVRTGKMVGGVFIATCCKSGQFEGENEVVRPRFHIRQDLNKVHAVVFWLKREKKVVLVVVKKLTFFGTIAPYNHKM